MTEDRSRTLDPDRIRLLVRGDDFGSTHAANLGCIDAYRHGILRVVEIMAPCPWFPEACRLLHRNPGLDVGAHLVLTSEWSGYRWRPLTRCSSITDEAGYFLPRVWPMEGDVVNGSLLGSGWRIDEVEEELSAQIDLCIARIPAITHLSGHMGWENAHAELAALLWKLARDYGFEVSTSAEPVQIMDPYEKSGTADEQVESFIARLRALTPGTWAFIDHPARDDPEMEGLGHRGYLDVGGDRGGVRLVLTSRSVVQAIEDLGIELITYRDLRVMPV